MRACGRLTAPPTWPRRKCSGLRTSSRTNPPDSSWAWTSQQSVSNWRRRPKWSAASADAAAGGVSLHARHGLHALESAGTVVVPGWRHELDEPPPALIASLRRAHARGARLISICSGAFVLAATGLLDGKRATTHWRYTKVFAERFPRVQLMPDVLYVDEGRLPTSAGSSAGLDPLM